MEFLCYLLYFASGSPAIAEVRSFTSPWYNLSQFRRILMSKGTLRGTG